MHSDEKRKFDSGRQKNPGKTQLAKLNDNFNKRTKKTKKTPKN